MRKLWNPDGPVPGSDEFRRIQAGIDNVMRHLSHDAWARPISKSASMIPDNQRTEPVTKSTNGWQEAAPLKGPDVRWCDAQMDAADERERLEALIKQRALVREMLDDHAATIKEPEPEVSPDPKAAKK